MVLYAYPIKLFYNLKKNRFTQFGLISISILIISYFTFFTYKNYLNLKFHSNYLKTGNFINYYPYKELVKIFLEEISLSAHEFNENIFFEGFSGYSKKLVKLFKRTNNSLNNDFRSKENRSCLFIIFKDDFTKQIAKWFKNKMMPSNGLTIFLSDKSLMIGPYKILRFGSGSSAMDFILFKYRSKYNQPCYENSSNQYSVAPKIISLLKELKKSDFQKNSNPILQLDKKITFNSDSELIKFGGDYLIIDPYIKTPIKISFAIVKENQRYKLKGAVNLYEFTYLTSKNKFNISRITFKIFDKNNQSYQDKKFYNFNLIEKSSLIGKMSLSNMTNRLFWRKEMSLPEFKFFFGKTFGVDLEIEAYFPNRKDKFYTNKFNLY